MSGFIKTYLSWNFLWNYAKDNRLELLRYLFVGLMGLVIDFTLFFVLVHFNVEVIVAQWFASLSGFTHNHLWQHYKIFTHNQSFKRTYTLGMVVSIISIVISGPLLVFIARYLPILWLAKTLMLGFLTLIQYIVRKKFIFINR